MTELSNATSSPPRPERGAKHSEQQKSRQAVKTQTKITTKTSQKHRKQLKMCGLMGYFNVKGRLHSQNV